MTPGSISPEIWEQGGWATTTPSRILYYKIILRVIAQSPILRTTITLERLKKRGYESMLDIYKQITPIRRDSIDGA
ncbi:hypothetical protein BZG02_17620 [Labilibaculum filiforme]|uniref:Uncharacterized protein n=1 Tax=Labilibaculum filiforme TaxID=1940526 RepID=A0A2N3HSD2_9BACT|nr:hypothetical protein BZG02_17620 [Labilibaculum filiforme]